MSLLWSLLYVLFALISSAYLIFRWRRQRLYELASKIPGTDGLPFLGEIHKFSNLQLKEYTKKLLSYCQIDHKISKGWFGPLFVVITEDADCIHAVLNSPHALFKPSYFYNAFYMDQGLLACNGEQYDRHRKVLNKSFTVALVQKFLPTFNGKAKKCVEKLSKHANGGDFDVFQFVGTCTLESFCSGQLNYHKDLYDSNFMHFIEETRPLVMKRMFSPWYNFKPLYKMSSLRRTMDRYLKTLYENIENIREANVKSPNGLLKDIVINVLMSPNNNFDDEEFRDEVTTFIMAVSCEFVFLKKNIHENTKIFINMPKYS
jgi:cytochrome P450